jgi:hypothetical protein
MGRRQGEKELEGKRRESKEENRREKKKRVR